MSRSFLCALLLVINADTAVAAEPAPPDSAAGRQLVWVLDILRHDGAVDKAALEAHFSAPFLAELPPEKLVAAFPQLAGHVHGMAIVAIVAKDDSHLVLRGTVPDGRFAIALAIEPATGKIAGLRITPDTGDRPTTVAEAEAKLATLAPRSQLLVAALDKGICRPLHAVNAGDELAIGSTFKL